ncbi:MAG TPA: AAA family ATPase, partial [Candidatus Limnocylindria bacterium]|nr:AAA family ATPase [Candidatus Limnocylindria bacterium]
MTDELKVIEGGNTGANAVLKTLTLTGFKSFVSRTHLEFAPGITAIIGPNGSGKCVPFWLQVTLADGSRRRIGDLVEEALSAGEVEAIDDGFIARTPARALMVASLDPLEMRFDERKVTAFVKRSSPPTLRRITTRSGRVIEATEYHPLFTIEHGQLRSLRADELRAGAFVALPRQLPLSGDRMALPLSRMVDAISTAAARLGARVQVIDRDEPALAVKGGKEIHVPQALRPELAYFLGAT